MGYHISVLNTICSATKERQDEALCIAGKVDAMLVVGDKHSSNTQKLFEISKKACNNTYYIQTPVSYTHLDVYKRQVSEKADAQVALSYTLGDAYTLEYWIDIAKRIEDMGATSICIKDMAGLLVPYKATELVQAMKEATTLPIQLHTHYTSGVASMTYLKAVEAGVDVIDTAISPFAMGTSQPATEVMVETFKGTPYDTGLDQKLLAEIADYFRPIRDEALESGLLNPKNLGVNIKTLLYQVPGGMLSRCV